MKVELKKSVFKDGTVNVSGAKNSMLKLLPASLLFEQCVSFENMPIKLVDFNSNIELMKAIGIDVSIKDSAVEIRQCNNININKIVNFGNFRTTYLYVPFQLKKFGSALIPYPNGCSFTTRGIDFHIDIWKKFGCNVELNDDGILVKSSGTISLLQDNIKLPLKSIGATDTAILMSAISSNEHITIENAYISPELDDIKILLQFLDIELEYYDNSTIVVKKNQNIKTSNEVKVVVQSDRIEVVSWICYAMITKSNLEIKNINLSHIESVLFYFRQLGLSFKIENNTLFINMKSSNISNIDIIGGVYPYIVTDMIPILCSAALTSSGEFTILDYRYPDRTQYIDQFKIGGIKFSTDKYNNIISFGKQKIKDGVYTCPDLRGGMALLLQSLQTEGHITLTNFEQVLRGYDGLLDKLMKLDVNIRIIDENISFK